MSSKTLKSHLMRLTPPRELSAIMRAIADDNLAPASLAYPPIALPEYQTGLRSTWRLERLDVPMLVGYYNGLHSVKHGVFVYSQGKDVIATTETRELEAMASHIACATGNVLIYGLEMGVALFNIAKKESVDKIIVIEPDRKVVNAFKAFAGYGGWPVALTDKIEIYANAEWRELPSIDYAYVACSDHPSVGVYETAVELWPKIAGPARVIGWTGMEVDYVDWCVKNSRKYDDFQSYSAWEAHHGMSVTYPDMFTWESHANLCKQAWMNENFN